MKCPKCKQTIEKVNVISECWQKCGVNEEGQIAYYGSIEEILGREYVEHSDNDCFAVITDIIQD